MAPLEISTQSLITDLHHTTRANVDYRYSYYPEKKKETKKERQKRIAMERMLASWKTFNKKTPTKIEIKQICKPSHRVNHMGRRF